MKKSKITYVILLAAIVIFVLYVYNGFNGNPISQYASKKVLEKYLASTYPDKNLRIQGGNYNFKFSDYSFKVIDIGEATQKKDTADEYEFQVTGFVKLRIRYDGIRIANIDQDLSSKLGDEAAKEINDLLSQKVGSIANVSVNTEVFKGKYDSNTVWNKNLKLSKPMDMHIVIDSTNMGKEDIYNTVVKIQDLLNQNGYEYSAVNINGNVISADTTQKDKYGHVKYALSFKRDTKLKIDDIKDIKK